MKLKYPYILFLIVFLSSCSESNTEKEEEPIFTFAVGGHIYGHPERYTLSVYPPFLEELDSLAKTDEIQLLILTGDLVARPTEENWENVQKELDALDVEWHIAPGNHDISLYMDQHIQAYKYIAFEKKNNLFLVLNTSHPGWTPDTTQQIFIKEALDSVKNIDNIFVFTHQLWWERLPPKEFELDSLRPNSSAGYEGESSFWEDAFFPYFNHLQQDVYFFAGDMGCYEGLPSYYEDSYKNFHFYGSGMGGGEVDNYLIGKIYLNGRVEIDRVDF